MNALFAGFINAFLPLFLTQNTLGENDGDGAQGGDFFTLVNEISTPRQSGSWIFLGHF